MSETKDIDLMEEDEGFLDTVITLTDDEGNEVPFEFLDVVELDGKRYVVLLPVDEDAEEVVILEVDESAEGDDPDSDTYISVEDEEILDKVFAIFKERFSDEFDFEEE